MKVGKKKATKSQRTQRTEEGKEHLTAKNAKNAKKTEEVGGVDSSVDASMVAAIARKYSPGMDGDAVSMDSRLRGNDGVGGVDPSWVVSMLEVERVARSPYNKRRINPGSADMLELAEDVKANGLISPVTVRPVGDGWELVCGERRTVAHRIAGIGLIPAFVRELSDAQAMEICAKENIQREDLAPFDAAEQVQVLLDAGHSVAEVADMVGKTREWVARRARLTRLSPAWRAAVANPAEPVSKWGVGLLEKVSKWPESTQDVILRKFSRASNPYGSDWVSMMTAEKLGGILGGYMRMLGSAPFDIADGGIVNHRDTETQSGDVDSRLRGNDGTGVDGVVCAKYMLACVGCVNRTDAQQELFTAEELGACGGDDALDDLMDAVAGSMCTDCTDPMNEEDGCSIAFEDCELVKAEVSKRVAALGAKSDARCLDPDCWQRKVDAHVAARSASLESSYGDRLVKVGSPDAGGVVREWVVEEVKEGTKGARPALLMEGARAGHEIWVRDDEHLARSMQSNDGREYVGGGGDGGEGKKAEVSVEEKMAEWDRKTVVKAAGNLQVLIEQRKVGDVLQVGLVERVLGLVFCFGVRPGLDRFAAEGGEVDRFAAFGKLFDVQTCIDNKPTDGEAGYYGVRPEAVFDLAERVFPLVKRSLFEVIQENINTVDCGDRVGAVERLAAVCDGAASAVDLNWDGVLAETKKARPYPKSWKVEEKASGYRLQASGNSNKEKEEQATEAQRGTEKKREELDEVLWQDLEGRDVFVGRGIGGEECWMAMRRKANGGKERIKSPALPVRNTRAEAVADLEVYARTKRWERAEEADEDAA